MWRSDSNRPCFYLTHRSKITSILSCQKFMKQKFSRESHSFIYHYWIFTFTVGCGTSPLADMCEKICESSHPPCACTSGKATAYQLFHLKAAITDFTGSGLHLSQYQHWKFDFTIYFPVLEKGMGLSPTTSTRNKLNNRNVNIRSKQPFR